MLLFLPHLPDFQRSPLLSRKLLYLIWFQCTRAVLKLAFSKLFFDLKILFKNLLCCNTFYNLHYFGREYSGSAPTKRWTWSPSVPIASNSKQYLSPISKHIFFKKIIISEFKRKFLRYFMQKTMWYLIL